MVDTFLLAKSFVTLLVITDPVGTVPIFLAITAEWGTRDRNRAAWQAVVVAALVIATFALFGQQILIYLGISVPSLQIAGGCKLNPILKCKEREVRSTGRTNQLEQNHREQIESNDFFKASSKSRQTR